MLRPRPADIFLDIVCTHLEIGLMKIIAVASLGLVSPGAVIALQPTFFDLFQLRNFAIFSLLHKKFNSSQIEFHDFFSLLHKRPAIYHTKFPLTFLTILPTKFIYFYHLRSE